MRFGRERGLLMTDLMPPKASTVIAFTSWLFLRTSRVSYGTAKSYLCHVKTLCKLLGHPTDAFRSPQLDYALRAYRKSRPVVKRPQRLPVTIPLLQRFRRHLRVNTQQEDTMLFAALCVGVYGLFRSGEIAVKPTTESIDYLMRADVCWSADLRSCAITLRASKTDPLRDGVTINLWANDTLTCPIRHLRLWWDHAPRKESDAPLFHGANGEPLTYAQLNKSIQFLAAKAGLDTRSVTGHSLRVGGATSLAMMGVPENVIQQLGRWRSLSYQLYVRMTDDYRENISRQLGQMTTGLVPDASRCFGGLSLNEACSLSLDRIGAAFRAR